MKLMKQFWFWMAGMLPLIVSGVEPFCTFPFDDSLSGFGPKGAFLTQAFSPGKIEFVEGVSGKALDVRRFAYDQVGSLQVKELPPAECREGTVSFFFRPNWNGKDSGSRWIFRGGVWKSPFYCHFLKPSLGKFELSVCAPKQLQLIVENPLTAGKWVHLAFSWNLAKGEIAVYINGKEAGRKVFEEKRNPEYSFKTSWSAWLGKGGSDRFTAEVAEGAFDNLKFFDRQLSGQEILSEYLGGNSARMQNLPLNPVRRNGMDFEVRFRADVVSFPFAQPLMEFGSGTAGLTLSTQGISGKLMVGGKNSVCESPYEINLTRPLKISVRPRGKMAEIWFDDAFQGKVNLPDGWTNLDSIRGIRGMELLAPEPSGAEMASLRKKASGKLEQQLWSLSDAEREEHAGIRRTVSLNGYWRISSDARYSYAPLPEKKIRYGRVPGSFRSEFFKQYEEKNGTLSPVVPESRSTSADWYCRTFSVPEEWSGKRIFLNFEKLNADYGRVYINGKLIHAFHQTARNFCTTPNSVRIDVTRFLEKENVLSVFLNRTIRYFWYKNLPDMLDSKTITIGDVRLESGPSPLFLRSAIAFPSFRRKTLEMRATVSNPERRTGTGKLLFRYTRADDRKVFEQEFKLTGEPEQRIIFTRPWKNPVLWNCETPNLYCQSVELSVNGKPADALPPVDFGFREAWVENGEFRLNGLKTRLRMNTNPTLELYNLYHANPRAIAQVVDMYKRMNYDTIRYNPYLLMQKNVGEIYVDAYLRECGRRGLYNLFPMPSYEGEEKAEYRKEVERFLEYYGRFPSILMWYTDFNTCSYPACQDPYYLNNTAYVPGSHILKARKLAAFADSTMRSMDPSRECFQHAGGNFGKIFGSMNYQSFGVPLQEQEDWPKIWSANHTQPLMVVEAGFPYAPQFFYFDGPKGHWLIAEHAARYFGDSVFRDEKIPAQFGTELSSSFSPDAPRPVNYFRLSGEMYKRVVRAWRGYDVSAIGDFSTLREAFRNWAPAPRFYMFWGLDNKVKRAGARPDAWMHYPPMTDGTEIEEHGYRIRREFAPLRVFLAGKTEDFTNKDHAFYSREKFEKSVVVVNDKTSDQSLRMCWKFVADGEVVDRGEFSATARPGEILKRPIRLQAPEVARRTDAKLLLSVYQGEEAFDTDEFAIQIFPKRKKPDFRTMETAGLYDPVGKTEALLKAAGFPYRKIEKKDETRNFRLLIIGQNALGEHVPDFLKEQEQNGEFHLGRKILIFEQKSCNLGNLVFESPSLRDAFIRIPESVYVRGLKNEDFSHWRGASDTVPEKIISDPDTPFHYPRSKWKIGNSGMVAGNVIRKPSYGRFRSIVDCGFNLMFSALMDVRQEHGYILFCQLDVTSRYGRDPVATILVDNMLREMGRPNLPLNPKRVVHYFGDDNGYRMLRRWNLECIRHDGSKENIGNLKQTVILGANPVRPEAREALRRELGELLRKKARSLILCLPGAPLDLLPVRMRNVPKPVFRAELPENDPMFRGLAEADLYFRKEKTMNVVESPHRLVQTNPAIFARYDTQQGGAIMVMNLSPDDFDDSFWNKEKVTRVWSTLFANMGLPIGGEQRFFTNRRMRHNTILPSLDEIVLQAAELKLDWKNSGISCASSGGFQPYQLGTSWEKQGFTQANPKDVHSPATAKKQHLPYDGFAWIRVKFTIPASWKTTTIRLVGGPIDDADECWLNGTKIGETSLQKFPDAYRRIRNYRIPESCVRFGEENTLLIRVFDRAGEGGVLGPLKLVSETPAAGPDPSPYVEKLNFYDVDAFHNW